MTHPAIYARQSLDRSGEGAAVSRQLNDCRDLVARNGWPAATEYVDNDVSASTSKPRPQWDRLLADLQAGRFDTVVCWHTDRLYRRVRDLVDLVELAERHALRIVTVRAADLDLTTPAGRMLAGMLGHAARYEAEQKGARQVAANLQRARAGRVLWTRRPFGYDRQGDAVVVVQDEAHALKVAAKAVLAGTPLGTVASEWNARGLTTTAGGRWTTTSLRRALLNPRYSGRAVYRGEDYGRGVWPAILSPATQAHLEEYLRDPRRRTQPSTAVKYLLSGLCRCGRCGAPMFASPMGPKGDHRMAYRCRSCYLARRMNRVDEVVDGVMVARLSRPDVLQLLSPDEDVDELRREIVELRDRREALAGMLAEGLLPAASVRENSRKLTDAISGLESRLRTALGENPATAVAGSTDVAAAWASADLMTKRTIINTLAEVTILPAGKGVRFDPESVVVTWRGPE